MFHQIGLRQVQLSFFHSHEVIPVYLNHHQDWWPNIPLTAASNCAFELNHSRNSAMHHDYSNDCISPVTLLQAFNSRLKKQVCCFGWNQNLFCNKWWSLNLGSGSICCNWSYNGWQYHLYEEKGGLCPERRRGSHFYKYKALHFSFFSVHSCSLISQRDSFHLHLLNYSSDISHLEEVLSSVCLKRSVPN